MELDPSVQRKGIRRCLYGASSAAPNDLLSVLMLVAMASLPLASSLALQNRHS